MPRHRFRHIGFAQWLSLFDGGNRSGGWAEGIKYCYCEPMALTLTLALALALYSKLTLTLMPDESNVPL